MTSRLKAMTASLVIGFGLLAMKLFAAKVSGSVALLSDALEGLVNILAAAFGMFAVSYSDRPADEDHPYGHGKIEYFAAAFEGGLIVLAAIWIAYEAFQRYLNPSAIQDLPIALSLSFFAGMINGAMGWYLIRKGKKERSQTLESDGHHLVSDFISSLILVPGVLIAGLSNIPWLDPVLAIFVALWLLKTGYKVIMGAIHPLLDTEDFEFIARVQAVIQQIDQPKFANVHDMKSRRIGSQRQLDFHIEFPENMTVKQAHEIADDLEKRIQAAFQEQILFQTHIDPVYKLDT